MSHPTNEMNQIGLKAVTFLSDNPDYLGRFFEQTGLSVDDLKNNIENPELQTGILDFFFADESLLMVFCSSQNIDPAALQKLYQKQNASDY